jgi:hypothetical protein
VLESLDGKRIIKETTSALAGCGITMSARETGGTSETGQTRWDPICPRRAFLACLALHAPWTLADFFSITLP